MVVAGLAVLALAGCDGASTTLGAASQELLHERVAQVRAAADSSDRDAAIAAVESFRAEVERLLDAGELTDSEAAGLLAHADAIATKVMADVVLPTPEPTPTATPEPTPEPAPVAAPVTPALSPEQILQGETGARFSEMLRERLAEYIEKRLAEREAQEKAEREKAEAERKQAEKQKAEKQKAEKKKDRNRDKRSGGSGAH
ncbi:hypothetical protein GCM10009547_45020 [Sporichthya brevicatena]|uniref:Uncharacterized protein n=1 Tax=Sporichthya brevicatena TaxID=171442 RepID=A0ABP3SEU7_9ACTN